MCWRYSIRPTSLAYNLGWYCTPVTSLITTMAAPTLRRSGGSPVSDRARVGTTASYPPPDARAPGWGPGGRKGGQVRITTPSETYPAHTRTAQMLHAQTLAKVSQHGAWATLR